MISIETEMQVGKRGRVPGNLTLDKASGPAEARSSVAFLIECEESSESSQPLKSWQNDVPPRNIHFRRSGLSDSSDSMKTFEARSGPQILGAYVTTTSLLCRIAFAAKLRVCSLAMTQSYACRWHRVLKPLARHSFNL